MKRTVLAIIATSVAVGATAIVPQLPAAARGPGHDGYEPVLSPAGFVHVITNPYLPWPVGRTLTYVGVKDGQTQTDVVHVTSRTKVIEGITAVTVTDIATHKTRTRKAA